MENQCQKCQGSVNGYKCDICAEEAAKHDDNHGCGGNHCVAKCRACGQAETKCTC